MHADQWWARAFDAGLKDLDLDLDVTAGVVRVEGGEKGKGKGKGVVKKEDNSMVVELRALADGRGGKWLGLYNGFVRGEGLSGTFEEVVRDEVVEMEGVDEKKKKRKRKKGEVDDVVDVAIGMERGGPSKKYRPKSVDESLIRHDEQVKKKKKKQKKSRHMKELASNG